MSTIATAIESANKALVPFIVGGGTDFAKTFAAVQEYSDVIEVGVPFSDPVADGPVIQEAAARAIEQGATIDGLLGTLREIGPSRPVVLMVSVSQVLAKGPGVFAETAAASGVSGFIIPDLPHEEADPIRCTLNANEIDLIGMVAPTSTLERRMALLQHAQGFAYLIAVRGVTGTRESVAPETLNYLQSCVEEARLPVCAGFGISTGDHIRVLRPVVDGFVVGSALVKKLNRGEDIRPLLDELRRAANGEEA